MEIHDLLLTALQLSVQVNGRNHVQTAKLRQFIHQNYPAVKDTAAKVASGSINFGGAGISAMSVPSATVGAKSSGFNGRTPINTANLKKSANISPVSAGSPAVLSDALQEEFASEGVADANVPEYESLKDITENDLAVIAELPEEIILSKYGRANIQELSVKLGFTVDVRKADVAFVKLFKKALLKALTK